MQANLGQILDAARIENVVLRTVITATLGLAITVLTQILSLIPTSTAVTAMKAQANVAIKPTSVADLKKQVNAFLTVNGYAKYAI